MSATTETTLFDLDQSSRDEPVPMPPASEYPYSEPDELEEPGGLRDVDCPLEDGWEGPRVGGDDFDDVVREAEFFLEPDRDSATEPHPQEQAPVTQPFVRTSVAVQATVLWINTLGDPKRLSPHLIEARAAEIQAMGQVRACRGRPLANGYVEIVTGILDWLAVRENAAKNKAPWWVLVDIEEMDDERAYKVAYAEAAEGVPLAPLDFARFVRQAIETTFKTQQAMAAKLGLHESNLTRLLKVDRCAEIVDGKVVDPWSISRAQAERFMRFHADKTTCKPLMAIVNKAEPQSARHLFAAVFAAVEPHTPIRRGEVIVTNDDGKPLGRVVRKGAGEVVLTLGKSAGQVELSALIRFVEAALAQLRSAAA